MRWLILNTDYPQFLRSLYARTPGLGQQRYDDQYAARTATYFGVADHYSRNLCALGHEARTLFVNNGCMQSAWAREHGGGAVVPASSQEEPAPADGWFPWKLGTAHSWLCDVLEHQVREFRPDVILNQAVGDVPSELLQTFRGCARVIIGQHASALPRGERYACYDLMLSSLPNQVEYFRGRGLPAALHRLAFEPALLESLPEMPRSLPAVFVGSVSPQHAARVRWLEALAARGDVQVWAEQAEDLPQASPLRQVNRGGVWGLDMYRVLRSARVALNQHIDLAGRFANNMRLYESTGVGSLLITDWKENLGELFELNREVLAYREPAECGDLIGYYLRHEAQRVRIAEAGQRRTLRDHTYRRRMQELIEIVEPLLSPRARAVMPSRCSSPESTANVGSH